MSPPQASFAVDGQQRINHGLYPVIPTRSHSPPQQAATKYQGQQIIFTGVATANANKKHLQLMMQSPPNLNDSMLIKAEDLVIQPSRNEQQVVETSTSKLFQNSTLHQGMNNNQSFFKAVATSQNQPMTPGLLGAANESHGSKTRVSVTKLYYPPGRERNNMQRQTGSG